jgi:glycosyltransferase involved in cell wall biosynthesis
MSVPRILIVTQTVDQDDPILGFFVRWIRAFVAEGASLVVIAQSVKTTKFPAQVQLHSLGKDHGASKWQQILRFWKLIWSLRHQYDFAFVHMTPVWIVLGAPLWILCRKRMYLWYEARGGGVSLRIAAMLVTKIFSASSKGMPFASPKTIVTGHGIDTDLFRPATASTSQSIITVGRITRSKNLPMVIDAFSQLPSDAHLLIAGVPITSDDASYLRSLEKTWKASSLSSRISLKALDQQGIVQELQHACLFLHASNTALDKALLEAMSCGCLVVSSAPVAITILPPSCVATPNTMGDVAKKLLALSDEESDRLRKELRSIVEKHHSLSQLAERLTLEMSS